MCATGKIRIQRSNINVHNFWYLGRMILIVECAYYVFKQPQSVPVSWVNRPDRVRRADDKTSDPHQLLKYAAKLRCLVWTQPKFTLIPFDFLTACGHFIPWAGHTLNLPPSRRGALWDAQRCRSAGTHRPWQSYQGSTGRHWQVCWQCVSGPCSTHSFC